MNKTNYKKALLKSPSIDHSALEQIINKTPLIPFIVNDNSNFVIITYWWGRGNLNKNLQYPCPEDVTDKNPLSVPPMKFEDMIEDWKRTCYRHKCNYLVAEYPEFAVPGGYQMAINAKPLFIKKALEAVNGRGVVYIDGDMSVNKYPAIFDIRNIDFMARGWNIDPRASIHYRSNPCYDPFIFETSGGTMYFGPTKQAKFLLDLWAKSSNKPMFAGKADDRILSMIYTMKNLSLPINTIQLPIEYLWLTQHYTPIEGKTYLSKKDYDMREIYFEHPACLTSEERAADQGAAKNRQPKFYENLIEYQIDCHNSGGFFYEYIAFPNKDHVKCLQPYLNFIGRTILYRDQTDLDEEGEPEPVPALYVIKYDDTYGKYKDIANNNIKKVDQFVNSVIGDISMIRVIIDNSLAKPAFTSDVIRTREQDAIAVIVACLKRAHNVLYIPEGTKYKKSKSLFKEINNGMEFVAFNDSDNDMRPLLLTNRMMYFKSSNSILQHMLLMCNTLSDVNIQLKSAMFIQRIRCNWLRSLTSSSSSSKNKSSRKNELKSFLSTLPK